MLLKKLIVLTTLMFSVNLYANIDDMPEMKQYSLEAYLANHIYDRSVSDKGQSYNVDYLGKQSTVKLLQYDNDNYSGFTAGIYKVTAGVDFGRVIVVFGGTGATDRNEQQSVSGIIFKWIADLITDLNLINFKKEDRQILQTRLFMDYLKLDLFTPSVTYDGENTIIAGHSLGGGLAQYASMYTDIKAVTFNTAPLPISEESQSHITYSVADIAANDWATNLKYANQISNIMAENDPLTSILYVVEGYETNNVALSKRMENIVRLLKNETWFQAITVAYAALDDTLLRVKYDAIEDDFFESLAFLNQNITHDNLEDEKKIDGFFFFKALVKLKNKDVRGFIDNIKSSFGIPPVVDLKRLIIGKRVVLPLGLKPPFQPHSMQAMLDSVHSFYANTIKLKRTGQVKSYASNGDEVTDGSLKDDGYYKKGYLPNYSRNDTKEIVTDHITGLEWQDNSAVKTIKVRWSDAVNYCQGLTFQGAGWRLPEVRESESILMSGRYNPSIGSVFQNYVYYNENVMASNYWTNTAYNNRTDIHWVADFTHGIVSPFGNNFTMYVRCVR